MAVSDPSKSNIIFKNFTELCSNRPSTSPGTFAGGGGDKIKKGYIQQTLCVSQKTGGGSISLVNHRPIRNKYGLETEMVAG